MSVAYKYTKTLVHDVIKTGGKSNSMGGNYIVINEQGFILTAAHVIKPDLSSDTEEITNTWWGHDSINIVDIEIVPNDLAIGKIEKFNPTMVSNYPEFGEGKLLEVGKEYEVFAIYPKKSGRDNPYWTGAEYIKEVSLPIEWEKENGRYIELRGVFYKGMSGGVIHTKNGIVIGLISANGMEQLIPNIAVYVSTGYAIHPDVIIKCLEDKNIDFIKSEYFEKGQNNSI